MAAASDPASPRPLKSLGAVLALSLALLAAAPAQPAASIRVSPNGQLTLPQAIAMSKDGDTIILSKGQYRSDGPVRISDRNDLTLTGESGARHAQPLDEDGREGAVFSCEGTVGLAITGCELSGCGAIGVNLTDCDEVEISGCTIEGNAALMDGSSIGELSMEGNSISETSDNAGDSRE